MNDEKRQENDLYNNPMVNAARNAMTPEQQDEYKKIGQYMYNSVNYQLAETGSNIKAPTEENLILYATESLKSGLSPFDLSDPELRALIQIYGDKWYEQFDYEESDVPKPAVQLVTTNEAYKEIDKQAKTLNKVKKSKSKYK